MPNAVRAGGNIPLPVRTVYVEPVYPEDARQAGIDGMVILEALIGEDGKVMDARIMRSIPALDAAALAAVRQWAFTPTVINGVPQKVVMSVDGEFPAEGASGAIARARGRHRRRALTIHMDKPLACPWRFWTFLAARPQPSAGLAD